jgi:hypothetical protein
VGVLVEVRVDVLRQDLLDLLRLGRARGVHVERDQIQLVHHRRAFHAERAVEHTAVVVLVAALVEVHEVVDAAPEADEPGLQARHAAL